MTVLVHKMLRLTTVVKCSSKTVSEVETWPIYVSVMGQTGAEQPTHPDTNPVSVQITCFRNRGGVPNSSEPADGSLERFQWRPLKLKSFFEGQRQTAPRQKRRSQGYPWRNVPYGARRSSRRWNPGTGSEVRPWPRLSSRLRNKREASSPLWPVDQHIPLNQTLLNLEKKDGPKTWQTKSSKFNQYSRQIAEDIDRTKLSMPTRRRCLIDKDKTIMTDKDKEGHLKDDSKGLELQNARPVLRLVPKTRAEVGSGKNSLTLTLTAVRDGSGRQRWGKA